MKPLQERLNDRLEQERITASETLRTSSSEPCLERGDSEVDKLVNVAWRLRTAPQIQTHPAFADMLERRMLRHYLVHQQSSSRNYRSFLKMVRIHPAFTAVAALCLLLLLSIGTLALAAQVTNPNNPFYTFKQWEQQMQYNLTASAADKAALDIQFARDRLNALSYLADSAHTDGYLQALFRFEEQMTTTDKAINALPPDTQKTRLLEQFGTLQNDARQELYAFLPKLAMDARIATTGELGHLGAQIPTLSSATLSLPTPSRENAIIHIAGSGIQPGAQLLVDGRQVQGNGTLQNGQVIFTLPWEGERHPHTLGILNPDGTVAQTNNITITPIDRHGSGTTGTGSQNSNGGTKGSNGNNGNNGNKPEATPTPHKNGENKGT